MDDDHGKTRMCLERPRRSFTKETILGQHACKPSLYRRGNQITVIQSLPAASGRGLTFNP